MIEATFLLNDIKARLTKRNQNWLAVVCGATGSGKSYSALRIAECLDKGFNADHVVFTSSEFMALLNSGTLKPGSVIVYDEAGVGLPAREFATLSNRLLMYVAQTFRHKNYAVIFTVPSFSFIDVQARRLLHAYIETISINRHENFCITKYLTIQVNPRFNDKIYYKYPRIVDSDGKIKVVEQIGIAKPSRELIKAYEAKRCIFTAGLNKSVEQQLKQMQTKDDKKGFDAEETAALLLPEVESVMVDTPYQTVKRHVSTELLMHKCGLSQQKAKIVRKVLEQKLKGIDTAVSAAHSATGLTNVVEGEKTG